MSPVAAALASMVLWSAQPTAATLQIRVVLSTAGWSPVDLIRLDTGKCAGRWHLDERGALEVRLPPGTYLVELTGAPGRPARVVSLGAGQVAAVVVGCPGRAKGAGPPFLGSVARPILAGTQSIGLGRELPAWGRLPAGPSR